MPFCTSRIRPKVIVNKRTQFQDALTSQAPEIWRGNDIKIEAAFFENDALVDVSCFDSVNLVIKDPDDLGGANIYEETVAYADINRSLVLANFTAGTDQHATFEIATSNSRFDMQGANTRKLWLVFYALTTDTPAKEITLGATLLTVHEDGAGTLENSPVVGDSLIPNGAVYDGSGNYVLAVTANKVYTWEKGANDTQIDNDGNVITTTETRFTAGTTEVTLSGTPDALVTAMVYRPSYYTAEESDARYTLAAPIQDLIDDIAQNTADIATNVVNILKAHGSVHESVADQTTMLALTANKGDIALRVDNNRIYWLNGTDASDINNWVLLPSDFDWQGTYNEAKTYTIGQAVFRLGSTYISQQNGNLDNDPDDPANVGSGLPWGLLAQGSDYQFSTSTPGALTVAGAGSVGTSGKLSHSDHTHPMPGLATSGAAGFMSAADKARFDLSEIGWANGNVNNAVQSGNWIFLIGDFTTWDNVPAPGIVKLDRYGKVDPLFDAGSGFSAGPSYIKVMPGGNLLIGHNAKTTYNGGSSAWVHMITPLGAVVGTWTSPATIAVSGTDELLALDILEDKILLLTHRTLRVTDYTGATLFTETGDDDFNNLAVIGCYAYLTSKPGATYGSTDNPQAIKALDFCEDSGGVFTGAVESLWGSQGGVGWNAGADCIIPDPNGAYIVAGGSDSHDGGSDYIWGGGSNDDGSGLIKLNAGTAGTRGTPFTGFDFTCTKDADSHVIPLAIDSLGRIYFTGNLTTINGTAVTAWNLYRVDAQGINLVEFTGFAGVRPTQVVVVSDDLIFVVGQFAAYGEVPIGRGVMIDATGARIHELVSDSASVNVGSYRERVFDAASMTPPSADPAEAAVNSTATENRVADLYLFADAAAEQVQIKTTLPQEWDGNAFKMKLVLQGQGSIVAGNIARFGVSAVLIEDEVDIDSVAWPAEVEVDTTLPDIAEKKHSPVFNVTPSGTHSQTTTMWIRIRRKGTHGNDTAGDKVRLHQARMQYKETTTEPVVWT